MPRRFSERPLKGTDRLSADLLNSLFVKLDTAVAALEEVRMVWDQQVLLFNTNALRKVTEAIAPLMAQIGQAAEGGFLVAETNDLVEIEVSAEISFFIPEESRIAFRPTPFLAILAPDEREDWAIGRLLVYNDDSGLLTVEILHLNGSGAERTGWTIAASSGVVEAVYEWMTAVTAMRDEVLIKAQQVVDNAAAVVLDKATVLEYRNTAGEHAEAADGHRYNASLAAMSASDSAEAAALSAASIAGGPVTSVAGLNGIVGAAALRTALGLVIGVHVQAFNEILAALSDLEAADGDILQFEDGAPVNKTIAELKTALGISAFAETLLNDADRATAQATLGVALVQIGPAQVVSSPVSAVVFDDIPATGFSKFILVGIDVVSAAAAANDNLQIHVSTNNGSSFKSASGDYYSGTNARAYLAQWPVSAATSTFKHASFAIDLIGLGNAARATASSKGHNIYGASPTNIPDFSFSTTNATAVRVAAEADNAFRIVTDGGDNIAEGTFILYGVTES